MAIAILEAQILPCMYFYFAGKLIMKCPLPYDDDDLQASVINDNARHLKISLCVRVMRSTVTKSLSPI